ncbi:MAG: glucose-6-phosphate dehydrogenase [Hyphomicrobiales bacterium]|nr:glucose-6-phosphate dehydrogenase [Hyphomicrobiales bacterium]
MASRVIPVDPFDLVVFGGTGDLARRKLYPALLRRDLDGQLVEPTRIFAVGRKPMADDAFRALLRDALATHAGADAADEAAVGRLLERARYVAGDPTHEGGLDRLAAALDGGTALRAFYLATAPDLFGPTATALKARGLLDARSRIVVEKPIGRDGASAAAINDALGAAFAEDRIFRIDHYLGKETVQNLMALRFANALFEPIWNSAHVDNVQITVAETIGVGSRGGYYDGAGALRDMAQNHLLQLLCLVAMEPPASLAADSVRDEKLKVLKSLAPIGAANAAQLTVRGQYRAGTAEGAPTPSYAEEIGKEASDTETFLALKVGVANWRWAGVPFYLRSGKRLARHVSEIAIGFRRVPHALFSAGAEGPPANRLVIRLQPDEGIKLWLMIKEPGPGGMRLQHVPLDMSFAQAFGARRIDAYERLLMDAIRGDATLFMRRDEVEAAWRFIDPIEAAWREMGEPPKPYAPGSWGPAAATSLIERDGRTWDGDIE